MVILDTCALIELFHEQPSFSLKTLKHIEQGAYVLSISFAEIACKVKLKKLIMETSPYTLYKEIAATANIIIVNSDPEQWFDSIDLNWENKDPVDRLIVAFACQQQLPIVTSDKKIKAFTKKVIW